MGLRNKLLKVIITAPDCVPLDEAVEVPEVLLHGEDEVVR